MYSIGIDTHARTHAVCILAEDGRVVKEFVVNGGVELLATRLKGAVDGPFRVCYEASLGYGTLYDRLAPIAAEIQVAHPTHLRAIFRSKRKTDRVDAQKLARLLRLGEVPLVHVPSAPVREHRVTIEHRRRLVDKRTRAKNGLRALLRSQGIDAQRGQGLFTVKGRAWVRELAFASPLTALRRDQLLREVEHLTEEIKEVTHALEGVVADDPQVALLRTIPGVGARTAEAFVAYVDDVDRFASVRHAAAYFGLVPCLDQSAGTARYGRITRQGPATARKLLTEAAWRSIALSPSMRAYFERIKGGKKDRSGVAIVAVAHRLVRVMTAMLKSGQPWKEGEVAQAAAPTP